jgi:Protein of unknown function (DUF4245)
VSGQAGRYQRSAAGMVGALLVLVVLVVGWIGLSSLNSDDPAEPAHTVDYAGAVPEARKAADFDLVAPPSLPDGWRATTVSFTDDPEQHWHLGVLTDQNRYVGLEQARRPVRSMVLEYVDEEPSRGATVDVAGSRWSTYTDDTGDLALVRRQAGTTTLVVGHDVPKQELLSYTAGLR